MRNFIKIILPANDLCCHCCDGDLRADIFGLFRLFYLPTSGFHYSLDREGGVLEPESPGIYLIKGLSAFETRIIVTSELDSAQHVWLNALRDNLSKTDAERFIMSSHELSAKDELEFADSVFRVPKTRNTNVFIQFLGGDDDMTQSLEEYTNQFFNAAIEKLANKKAAEIAAKMQEEAQIEEIAIIRAENEAALQEKDALIEQMDTALGQMNVALEQQKAEIIELKRLLAENSTVQSVTAE